MGLFTPHNCCVSCLLNFLKPKLESKSRLPIPEFSGYHRNKTDRTVDVVFSRIWGFRLQ